jgi:uncharacterized membrane protein YoaT (DUF817 family)
MEIFKVHMGSWAYPEAPPFKVFDVPLFPGFMYASGGSFIARAIRVTICALPLFRRSGCCSDWQY